MKTLELESYASFLDTVPDATLVVDASGTIVIANTLAERMFHYAGGALAGLSVQELVPRTARAAHAAHVRRYADHGALRSMGGGGKLQLRGSRRDGTEFPVDIMLRPADLGGVCYTICVVRDITAHKQVEHALQESLDRERLLAHTDALTGVANVRRFRETLEQEVLRFRRYRRPFSLLYLDLDHFKALNDARGHAAGDAVLCHVARSMTDRLRATDCVARLGGDEFAALLPETDAALARQVAADLRQGLLAEMGRHGWAITFSIGVVTCIEPPPDAETLVRRADALMYSVKAAGRDAVHHGVYEAVPVRPPGA